MNILVLAGGTSSEREVSLNSGIAVREALETVGHTVVAHDPIESMSDTLLNSVDVIFSVLHGTTGEDGTMQTELESRGFTNFVGSNSIASALCFDKWRYRELLASHNVRMAEGAIVDGLVQQHELASKPFVLKPVSGGSSVDTFIIRDPEIVDWQPLEAAREQYGHMLIEELITGIELTAGVLGETALPIVEIIPPEGAEFDYENKYNGSTQELCPPHNIPTETQDAARELALRIHQLAGCRDMSRTDMIATLSGELYVLETNTLPGMTKASLLPKAAAALGIDMPALCDRLVHNVLQRA